MLFLKQIFNFLGHPVIAVCTFHSKIKILELVSRMLTLFCKKVIYVQNEESSMGTDKNQKSESSGGKALLAFEVFF